MNHAIVLVTMNSKWSCYEVMLQRRFIKSWKSPGRTISEPPIKAITIQDIHNWELYLQGKTSSKNARGQSKEGYSQSKKDCCQQFSNPCFGVFIPVTNRCKADNTPPKSICKTSEHLRLDRFWIMLNLVNEITLKIQNALTTEKTGKCFFYRYFESFLIRIKVISPR